MESYRFNSLGYHKLKGDLKLAEINIIKLKHEINKRKGVRKIEMCQDIKHELKKIFYLDNLINSELEQLERLKNMKVTVRSLDYSEDLVSHSPSNSGFTTTIERIVDLETKINLDIDELVARRDWARVLFSHLDDDLRLLMTERYLNTKSWDEVANSLFCSLRKAYYLHGIALNELRKLKELED